MSQVSPSKKKKTRAYHSPRRQEQASNTKARIVKAALRQLQEKGYADMTLESIAREAGVASQTVYAVCGSKKGVLASILENSVESNKYDRFRDAIKEKKDGLERVKALGHFHSLLLGNAEQGFHIMHGAGVVSPDLAELETDNEMMLYDKNLDQIRQMAEDGLLKPGLDVEEAADMYFALCAPGVYRRLTRIRGWTSERYIEFISAMFRHALLAPEQDEK